ncbi:hypothetical protein EVU96_17045 [Bacillus infantis]|uniref:hypothetical protein n=1 Tax=Bacillus infantis TaxID=324767 RepID=UPI00101C92AF|nr:hypothetical protein [Bacillus infantis]RYI27490.1 hypothetical protein EVU96_17045 [Bacillus infantis]
MKINSLILVILAVLLAACGNSQDEAAGKKEPVQEEEAQKEEQDSAEDEDSEKEAVETTVLKAREDAGDYDVKLEGEIHRKDQKITVTGTTNLLPGSKLFLYTDPLDGAIIGSAGTTLVEEDGSFTLEDSIPDGYKYPVIYTKIIFKPSASSDEVNEHYSVDGSKLEGAFVRLDEEGGEHQKQIVAVNEIDLSQPESTVMIEEPEWSKPDDYGAVQIRMETEVTEDEDFIYVNGKSNILEGASVTGGVSAEGYIITGFNDRADVMPDGSFRLVISNPMTEIKDLKSYQVKIMFDPTDGNGLSYIKETYGEKGEKLQGGLIKDENGTNMAVYSFKVGK